MAYAVPVPRPGGIDLLNIRRICAGDRDYFCAAVQAFYQSPAVCHAIPEDHAARTFDALMPGSPYADCLIAADDDGRPVAYCLLALTWSNEAGGLCVWLDELMVDASQRSRGIGRQLIAAVQEKYRNAARFRLEVTEANPRAAALYRTLGFTDLPYQQMVMDSAT